MAHSPLNRAAWDLHLVDYPERDFVDAILNIIDVGASIGHSGPPKSQSCKNLKSALDHPAVIAKEIESLLSQGRIHGPFAEPPLPNFRCSPLGTASRKRDPKLRVFNHYSWPKIGSVNDETPDSEGTIQYDSFTSAAAALRDSGRGSLLAKLDLKDAYRHIPVRCTDWNLLGFHWLDKFYYPVVLMFGGKSAPYIFNLFAEALHWIIQRHIPANLRHYLDDFLPIFRPTVTVQEANAAIDWIEKLAVDLGLSFQAKKTVRPTTSLEFLGLELDSSLMEARLPSDKLIYLRDLLARWDKQRQCDLRSLQELIGFLQFCAQVVPHGRTFIRGLINFSMTFQSEFSRRHVPAYARSDIHWWSIYAQAWNGVQILEPTKSTIHICTDASGLKGLGGIFGDKWFSSRCPRRFRTRDIQFKEIYAVLQAILRWGIAWKGHHVVFHVDNTAIASSISSGTNRNAQVMNVLRSIVMLAARLEFSYSSSWLSSSDNPLADAASRFEYARLFTLAPYMQRKPCQTLPQLRGIKHTLTCRQEPRSSYGMASHPRPARLIGQDKSLSQTSSPCTLNLETQTAQCFQPLKRPCSNGSHGSVGSKESSQNRSRHTLHTFDQATSTQGCHSQHANLLCSSESYGGSRGTWGNAIVSQSCPSHATYSRDCSRQQPTSPCWVDLTSRPPSQLPSQDSSDAGNLQFRQEKYSILASMSPGAAWNSCHPCRRPPTSSSPSRPQKWTPSGRAWQSQLPARQERARAQWPPSKTFSSICSGRLNPPSSFRTMANHCRGASSSQGSEQAFQGRVSTPLSSQGTASGGARLPQRPL